MALLAGVTLLAVDTETQSLSPENGYRVVEVARVAIVDGKAGERWSSLVRPVRPTPPDAERIHGIKNAETDAAPLPAVVGRLLRDACADLPLVFHNAPFDLPFLRVLFEDAGVPPLANPIVDTLGLARGLPARGANSLGALAKRYKLVHGDVHRALGDALAVADLLPLLAAEWESSKGIRSLAELAAVSQDVMRATGGR